MIKKIKNFFSIETADRAITGGQLKQFISTGFLLTIIFAGLIIAYMIFRGLGMEPYHNSQDWIYSEFKNIHNVFCHFIDPGYLDQKEGFLSIVFFSITSFLGMILVSGLLITTMVNVVERRVNQVERGEVTYRKVKNHYVIIGYSEITLCLIAKIFEKEKNLTNLKHFKIIIISTTPAKKIHSDILSRLPKEYGKYVLVYHGNIESKEQFERLNIANCKELCLLGELGDIGRDIKNIESIKTIANLRGKDKELLRINVQIEGINSYSILQKINMFENYSDFKENIYFRPFSFYENWARLLWSYHKLEAYDDLYFLPLEDGKSVHLVIVGFNGMGRALLLEALRICHYCNFVEENKELGISARNKTKITVIDKNLEGQLPAFKSQFPYLNQIEDIEIEYISDDIESVDVKNKISSFAKNEAEMLTVAVCIENPDLALSMSLNLPKEVFYQANRVGAKDMPRILVRQEVLKGIGSVVAKDEGEYANLKIFGMLSEGISNELLDDSMAMCTNMIYNGAMNNKINSLLDGEVESLGYIGKLHKLVCTKNPDKDSINRLMRDMLSEWSKLPENMRWANRYQIDIYNIYKKQLSKLGIKTVLDSEKCSSEKIKTLAQSEHLRWVAERSIMGWRQMREGESRNDKHMIHNLILPFHKLNVEVEIEKDRLVIRNLLQIEEIFKKLKELDL